MLEIGEQLIERHEVGAEGERVLERRPRRCPNGDDQGVVRLVGPGRAVHGAQLGINAERDGSAEAPVMLNHEGMERDLARVPAREGPSDVQRAQHELGLRRNDGNAHLGVGQIVQGQDRFECGDAPAHDDNAASLGAVS